MEAPSYQAPSEARIFLLYCFDCWGVGDPWAFLWLPGGGEQKEFPLWEKLLGQANQGKLTLGVDATSRCWSWLLQKWPRVESTQGPGGKWLPFCSQICCPHFRDPYFMSGALVPWFCLVCSGV